MKIFIVHKGMDADYAYLFKNILTRDTGSDVLVLENAGRLWKIEAAKLIDSAQLILFIVGPESSKSPYIGWELKKAIDKGKQIYYLDICKYEALRERIRGFRDLPAADRKECLDLFYGIEQECADGSRKDGGEEYTVHEALKTRNHFTKEFLIDSRVKKHENLTSVISAVRKYNSGDYEIFNCAFDSMNESQLFEQYKLYLSTSESLVSRRQSVSTFYLSANSALVTVCSVIFALLGDISEKMLIAVVISLVGIIMDVSWMRILDAYGTLNASKMKIISLIEKRLPVSLYDKEWDVMSDKLNGKKYVSFTDSEKRMPHIFITIYLIVIFASILLAVVRMI